MYDKREHYSAYKNWEETKCFIRALAVNEALLLQSKVNDGRLVVNHNYFLHAGKEKICIFNMGRMSYILCKALCTLKCWFNHSDGPTLVWGCALTSPHFLKFTKFVNKILYFYILFYLYLYNWTHWFYFL